MTKLTGLVSISDNQDGFNPESEFFQIELTRVRDGEISK